MLAVRPHASKPASDHCPSAPILYGRTASLWQDVAPAKLTLAHCCATKFCLLNSAGHGCTQVNHIHVEQNHLLQLVLETSAVALIQTSCEWVPGHHSCVMERAERNWLPAPAPVKGIRYGGIREEAQGSQQD